MLVYQIYCEELPDLEWHCYSLTRNVCLLLLLHTITASKCIYNTIIQPCLGYADTAWGILSAGCNQELQRLQNREAQIIMRSPSFNVATSLLKWINLEKRSIHQSILVNKFT